jgi:DNA (cytosine-5)-methyltransferase 1
MTRKDYDEVKHYGNVTKINGAEVEPVDIITFGSPCQDLRVTEYHFGRAYE